MAIGDRHGQRCWMTEVAGPATGPITADTIGRPHGCVGVVRAHRLGWDGSPPTPRAVSRRLNRPEEVRSPTHPVEPMVPTVSVEDGHGQLPSWARLAMWRAGGRLEAPDTLDVWPRNRRWVSWRPPSVRVRVLPSALSGGGRWEARWRRRLDWEGQGAANRLSGSP